MSDGTNGERHKTARQKSPSGFLLCVLAAVLLCGILWYAERERYYIYRLHRVMPTGFENQGLTIHDVELDNTVFSSLIGHGVPSSTALRAETNGQVFWLTSLGDLKGRLRIANAADALSFVRIGTSDGMMWSRMAINSGLEIHKLSDTGDPNCPWKIEYGMFAVLTDSNYAVDGFYAPTVTATADGYVVTRWIWVASNFPNPGNVELWEETVTRDAGYSRRILVSKPAPVSHGEAWMRPMRK